MEYLDKIKEIYKSDNLLKTELYNEGWMLRLVLFWFHKNPQCSYNDKISMKQGVHWFSEGRLESPFKKDKELGIKKDEGYTQADGVYGNIEIGDKGDSDIKLAKNCKQFIVTEAKIYSKFSKRITHIKKYDQAARNIACMYQIVENYRNSDQTNQEIEDIAFYTLLPQSQIEDERTFTEYTSVEHILETIENRIKPYNGKMKEWKEWFDYFSDFLNKIKIELISWEEIRDFIISKDKEYGIMLSDFYNKCLKYNKPKINSKNNMNKSNNGRGVSLIYCPEINKHSFVHFSWSGNSARIRNYISDTEVREKDFLTEEIRKKDFIKEIHLSSSDRKVINDKKWWYEYIQMINKENNIKC